MIDLNATRSAQVIGLGRVPLDVGCPDHFGPLLRVHGNQLSKVGGGKCEDSAAQAGNACLDRGLGEARGRACAPDGRNSTA